MLGRLCCHLKLDSHQLAVNLRNPLVNTYNCQIKCNLFDEEKLKFVIFYPNLWVVSENLLHNG